MAATYLGCDGFETGGWRGLTANQQFFAIQTAQKHTGTYSALVSTNGWFRYPITGTPDNCSISVWIRLQNLWSSGACHISLVLTTGEEIKIQWNSTSKSWDFYVDGVLTASGTTYVEYDTWHNIQFWSFFDNAGFGRVKINGVLDINYSGDTLPVAADASVAYLMFYNPSGNDNWYIDDVAWGTDDYLGDCRVEWVKPNADTAVEDWTPSTGVDSYAMVDEVPLSDSDYLYTPNNADETELALTAWDGTGKTPLLVVAWVRAREEAATGEQLNVGIDSNGTDDVTLHTVSDDYRYYDHVMQQNPDGPAAWNEAAIQAALSRIEAVI